MWRHIASPMTGHSDSDQSISDEEHLNCDARDDCFSLNTNAEKERGLLLQSQLELLKGSDENQSSLFVEDEVEMPDFPSDEDLILSHGRKPAYPPDVEIISDAENDYAVSKHFATRSASKLQKGSAFPKANKTCKGVRRKVKPKFSVHYNLHKDGLPQCPFQTTENVMSSGSHGVSQQSEPTVDEIVDNAKLGFLDGFYGENDKRLKILSAEAEADGNGLIKHTMAELLYGLQDGNAMLRGTSEMFRKSRCKRARLIVKKHTSPMEENIIDNEEQSELVFSGSSGGDEADYKNLYLTKMEMKKQTMADQFQEALAATPFTSQGIHVTAANLSGIGLFGKLQQIMQSEKERDADFLKRMQMVSDPLDESRSIFVKILSRYLDAKLIVCRCSFGQNIKGFQLPDRSQTLFDRGREGTVIFNPRVCSDVELEVGNFICIHPTWKEIQVTGEDDTIILSTYFSHIKCG